MPEQSLIPGRQQVALAAEDRGKKNACSRPEWVSLRLQMVVGGGRRRICHFLSGLQSLTCLASRIAGERFGGGMRSSVSTQI